MAASLTLLSGITVANDTPIRISVRSPAAHGFAKRLASSVVKELGRDPRFMLLADGTPGVLTVWLPSDVGRERSLDWTRITFQARLVSVDGSSRVITGGCWNWNIRDCAQQIAIAAAQGI